MFLSKSKRGKLKYADMFPSISRTVLQYNMQKSIDIDLLTVFDKTTDRIVRCKVNE